MAMRRLMSTTTDTRRYMPKTILNKMLVHSGWSNFLSVDLICRLSQFVKPNTAKKSFSKALIGLSLTATKTFNSAQI